MRCHMNCFTRYVQCGSIKLCWDLLNQYKYHNIWDTVDLCTSWVSTDWIWTSFIQYKSRSLSSILNEDSTSDDPSTLISITYILPPLHGCMVQETSILGHWTERMSSSQGHQVMVAGEHSKGFCHHKFYNMFLQCSCENWYNVKNNNFDYILSPCYTWLKDVPRQLFNWYTTLQHCFIQKIQNTY